MGVAALVVSVVVACSSPTRPELRVDVLTPDGSLIPSAIPVTQSTTPDATICCCRVVGNVVNRSLIPVHVTLKFEAFENGEDDPVATAFDFLEALQGQATYSAVGFIRPCSTIDRVELADVDLRGIGGG